MIGEALRLIRVYHDLKQGEVAARLGISQSYLSEIEKGLKAPTLEILNKYSEVFNIPISSIMYFSENFQKKSAAADFVSGKILSLLRFIEQRAGRADVG